MLYKRTLNTQATPMVAADQLGTYHCFLGLLRELVGDKGLLVQVARQAALAPPHLFEHDFAVVEIVGVVAHVVVASEAMAQLSHLFEIDFGGLVHLRLFRQQKVTLAI